MYDLPGSLEVEAAGAVRVLRLNRPEQRNAIDPELRAALTAVWTRIADDEGARAVLLTGRGSDFSVGGDIGNLVRNREDHEHRRRTLRAVHSLLEALIGFHLPVVAAVNGPAVGIGCNLALLSDAVVMAESAYFADTHVAAGLVAGDGGPAFWPLLVGLLRAKDLVLFGEPISAARAAEIGLATRVVADGRVEEEGLALAARAAELPPAAVQDTKRAFNLHLRRVMGEVGYFASAAESESFLTPELGASLARRLNRPS